MKIITKEKENSSLILLIKKRKRHSMGITTKSLRRDTNKVFLIVISEKILEMQLVTGNKIYVLDLICTEYFYIKNLLDVQD